MPDNSTPTGLGAEELATAGNAAINDPAYKNSAQARYIKFYYGQANRLRPDTRAALDKAVQEKNAGWTGFGASSAIGENHIAITNQLAAELGISPKEASSLLNIGIQLDINNRITDPARKDAQWADAMKYMNTDADGAALNEAITNGSLTGDSAAPEAAAPDETWKRGEIQRQLQEFAKRMMDTSVDENGNSTDSLVNQLAKMGQSQGLQGASNRGIQGGVATQIGLASAQQSAMPYLQQKNALGLQALGMVNNASATTESLAQDAAGLNLTAQRQANDVSLGAYNQKVNAAQGAWGTVGAIGGGILGAYAGNSKAGATMGSNLLGGLGGSGVPRPNLQSPRPYKSGGSAG